MNGLQLSRDYFFESALPRLKNDFSDKLENLAAGLVGNGSECFGYDDEISRDHDWGVDFFIWVLDADRTLIEPLLEWKRNLFEKCPPKHPRTRSEYGAGIGVMTVGDFYASLIGAPSGPQNIQEWRRVPEENLAMSVNGGIFIDGPGEFTRVRNYILNYYPEDLRLKKIAARCMALAQTGQYNLDRTAKRRDWVTLRTVLSQFADSAIAMVFLLNRVFRPYYKWAFKRMTELPVLGGEVGARLNKIALTGGLDVYSLSEIGRLISEICAIFVDELRRQGVSGSDDWFLTSHGEEAQSRIRDEFLKKLPTQYE